MLIDTATAFGARAAERLRDERLIWLTTVDGEGTPQPTLVWFHWDGADQVLVYSLPDAHRVANIKRNPRVALHFDSGGSSANVLVFLGTARLDPDFTPADRSTAYLEKYIERIEQRLQSTPERFTRQYSLPVRITLTRLRGR